MDEFLDPSQRIQMGGTSEKGDNKDGGMDILSPDP